MVAGSMYETILVPIDGSDHANKAVDLAADLAGKFKARVILLHVLLRDASALSLLSLVKELNGPKELVVKFEEIREALINSAAAAYGPMLIPVPVNLLEEVGNLIGNNAKKLAEASGAENIEVHVCDGVPANLILAAAKHENADVIVMGSRGLGHFTGMVVGSVSHKVNHLSDCTCITVK